MSKHAISLLRNLLNRKEHGRNSSWHGHSRSSGDHSIRHHENRHYDSHGYYQSSIYSEVLSKGFGILRQNKRLAILIAIGLLLGGSIFLVCTVWIAVKLIGLAAPLFGDIEKNGLKSMVDTIGKIIATIWQGTGK
jgi:hypothetical protein